MRRIEYGDISDFAKKLNDIYFEIIKHLDDFGDISIIAKFAEAKQIIEEFISNYNFKIIALNISPVEYENYCDEYIITIASIDGENSIFCDTFKKENGYLNDKSTISFVLDNCCIDCTKKIKSNFVVEVGIQDECETDLDDCTSESVYVSRDDEGNPVGFSKSSSMSENGTNCYSSLSYYSDDFDTLMRIAKDIGVKL